MKSSGAALSFIIDLYDSYVWGRIMRYAVVLGLLISTSLSFQAATALAQGLKIDPYPNQQRAQRLVTEGPGVENKEFRNFTEEALRQLEAERALPGGLEIVDEPMPAKEELSNKETNNDYLTLDPIPLAEPKESERKIVIQVGPDVTPERDPVSDDILPPPSGMEPYTRPAQQQAVKTAPPAPAYVRTEKEMNDPPMGDVYKLARERAMAENVRRAEEQAVEESAAMASALLAAQPAELAPVTAVETDVEVATAAGVKAEMNAPVDIRRTPIVVLGDGAGQSYKAADYTPGWNASSEQSLRDVLQRWSKVEGASLIWDTKARFSVARSFKSEGSFEEAVGQLLEQSFMGDWKPVGQLFVDPVTGVKVLTVKAERT